MGEVSDHSNNWNVAGTVPISSQNTQKATLVENIIKLAPMALIPASPGMVKVSLSLAG